MAGVEELAGRGEELALEVEGREVAEIRAAQQPAVRGQHVEREGGQRGEVALDPEHLAGFVAGKRGRIEDDGIEFAAVFGKPFEPLDRIALAKMMGGGIQRDLRPEGS